MKSIFFCTFLFGCVADSPITVQSAIGDIQTTYCQKLVACALTSSFDSCMSQAPQASDPSAPSACSEAQIASCKQSLDSSQCSDVVTVAISSLCMKCE